MALIRRSQSLQCEWGIMERGMPKDREGLEACLFSGDVSIRRWAARDLVCCSESAPVLVERLLSEPHPVVREAIFVSLLQISGPIAIEGMIQCLRSESAALRNEAIETMKNLPESIAPLMAELLEDDDPDVRIFAVNILESLRHFKVESWLIKVISEDAHVNVCATAVDLLGEVGSFEAVEPLQELKARFADEPYIQFAADLALRRIEGDTQ
ncbi:HEAT repeat domain-containing protein [Pokkaliibacter sp. CJK22405]|uniref:HEAT repeat domain-containing protein n=1 Tax=Pokkaliibacter sp. CJK22405 TaxID=3384615 RepID=UPI0039847023